MNKWRWTRNDFRSHILAKQHKDNYAHLFIFHSLNYISVLLVFIHILSCLLVFNIYICRITWLHTARNLARYVLNLFYFESLIYMLISVPFTLISSHLNSCTYVLICNYRRSRAEEQEKKELLITNLNLKKRQLPKSEKLPANLELKLQNNQNNQLPLLLPPLQSNSRVQLKNRLNLARKNWN